MFCSSLPHVSSLEDVLRSMEAMRKQEERYQCSDYLDNNNNALDASRIRLMRDFRSKMCEWCYQVVHLCGYSRETVAVAMSCLDRFVSTNPAYLDRKRFQLAAMACLYTSIKIYESEAITPDFLAHQGGFSPRDVTAMETRIAASLGWRLHPPTAYSFVHHLLALYPTLKRKAILETARVQTELAVQHLVGVRASAVAVAAIANAMGGSNHGSIAVLAKAVRIQTHQALAIKTRLFRIPCTMRRSITTTNTPKTKTRRVVKQNRQSVANHSPRSVASTAQ